MNGVIRVGGPSLYGKVAVILGLAVCLAIGVFAREVEPSQEA